MNAICRGLLAMVFLIATPAAASAAPTLIAGPADTKSVAGPFVWTVAGVGPVLSSCPGCSSYFSGGYIAPDGTALRTDCFAVKDQSSAASGLAGTYEFTVAPTSSQSPAPMTAGVHQMRFYELVKVNGSQSSCEYVASSIVDQLVVDPDPPVVTSLTHVIGQGGTVTLMAAATDAVSGVETVAYYTPQWTTLLGSSPSGTITYRPLPGAQEVWVATYDKLGNSNSGMYRFVMPGAPAAVTTMYRPLWRGTRVRISWPRPARATSFRLQRLAGRRWVFIGAPRALYQNVYQTASVMTYRVRAESIVGVSVWRVFRVTRPRA